MSRQSDDQMRSRYVPLGRRDPGRVSIVARVVAAPSIWGAPASLVAPLADSWPTYSGDYTGRRYSALTQVNRTSVKHLSLAWASELANGRTVRPGAPPIHVGGHGADESSVAAAVVVKGSILQVNGVLYVTAPDYVWALDARDGRELWRYVWKTRGGTHIANRGAAMWNSYLFFETPDDYLVSLDARTGKERWNVEIADFDEQYFSTPAPLVVDNHVLVGTGKHLDDARFPVVRSKPALQWKLTVLMKTSRSRHVAELAAPATVEPGLAPGVRRTRAFIVGSNPTPAHRAARAGELLYVFADRGQRRYRQMGLALQTSTHDTTGFGADTSHQPDAPAA